MMHFTANYYWFPFYMSVYNSHEGMETEEPVQVFTLNMTLRIHLILHTLVV